MDIYIIYMYVCMYIIYSHIWIYTYIYMYIYTHIGIHRTPSPDKYKHQLRRDAGGSPSEIRLY